MYDNMPQKRDGRVALSSLFRCSLTLWTRPLDNGDDVGKTCYVEDFFYLWVHVAEHEFVFSRRYAFLQHEEHAEALRGGVGHIGAVYVDVACLGLH